MSNDVVQFLTHNNTATRQPDNPTTRQPGNPATRIMLALLPSLERVSVISNKSVPHRLYRLLAPCLHLSCGQDLQISSSLSSPFRGCAVRPGFLRRREAGVPPAHQRGCTIRHSSPYQRAPEDPAYASSIGWPLIDDRARLTASRFTLCWKVNVPIREDRRT